MTNNANKVGTGKSAALYARMPEPYERDRTSLSEQLDACRKLARELGYATSDENTFTDSGPNTTFGRPGLSAMLASIADGSVQAIVTNTLDRLGRSESRLLEVLLKELRRRKVPIYTAKLARGYRYSVDTGQLLNDPVEVAAASQQDWTPPEYIIIPSEDQP